MRYSNTKTARFLSRPNRFVAMVSIDGKAEAVHVKNTGRCKELLIPGSTVVLTKPGGSARKTSYDLIAVYRDGQLINIDSQAPNKAAKEWLETQNYDVVKPEYKYGNSRIDFYMKKGMREYLMEVKGCTLERQGIGYFPDAPTERGVKHLRELIGAKKAGYECAVAFVIQMEGVTEVRANEETHPEFKDALEEARAAGVKVLFLMCKVEKDSLRVVEQRE